MSRDLNLLHPEAKKKALQLIQKCKEAGIDIVITQTLRTKKEQDALYAQGRTKPGRVVTNAKYPESLHCWGVAFDFAIMRGKEVIWDISEYAKVGQIGESLGLEWGGRWEKFPDYPHFQLPGYSWQELLKKYGKPLNFVQAWPKEEDEAVASGDKQPVRIVVLSTSNKEIKGGYIENGTTMAPVRALAEALGRKVEWDAGKKEVRII